MRRIKAAQVKPLTEALLRKQGAVCPICKGSLSARSKKTPALDHDHATGYIRDVLCLNCNGLEGKIHNLVRRLGKDVARADGLQAILDYWRRHETPQHGGIFHHTHLTPEEARVKRNARAKLLRQRKKVSP